MNSINYTLSNDGKRTALAVESWDEMTAEQFLATCKTIELIPTKPEARYQLPLILSNIKTEDYKRFNSLQATQLVAAFDWLMRYEKLPTKWLIEKVRLSETRLSTARTVYGPDDRLKNLVWEEFMYAESMLEAFAKSKKGYYLDQFLSILMRPKSKGLKYTGDHREPFNRHTVEARAAFFSRSMDAGTKLAIELNYLGCKAQFPKMFPNLFSTSEPTTNKKETFTWLDAGVRLANHVPSEYEALKTQNAHEVLKNLDLKVKDNKEMQREMEEIRRKAKRK